MHFQRQSCSAFSGLSTNGQRRIETPLYAMHVLSKVEARPSALVTHFPLDTLAPYFVSYFW